MSIENFVSSLHKQLADARADRAKATVSQEKGALTRKIHDIELALKKATRKGVME